jgi:hypothetical protein
MRKYRKQREAYDAALQAVWAAECSRPVGMRQWFRAGDMAEELARDPQTLEVNVDLRDRIVEQLIAWIRNQQFDLATGEVATLNGDPPSFEPLAPLDLFTFVTHPEWLMLRRDAARRFVVEHPDLPSAAGLLRRWFGDIKAVQLPPEGNAAPLKAAPEGNAAPLKPAPDPEIHEAITKAYDSAKKAGEKPPNVKQIAAPVQAILRNAGYQASGNRIQQLASDARHDGRRRKPGKTVASEKRLRLGDF